MFSLFAVKSDSSVSNNVDQQDERADPVVEVVVPSADISNNPVNQQSNDRPSFHANLVDPVELENEVIVSHVVIEQTGQSDVPTSDKVTTDNTIGARSFYGKRMQIGGQPSRKKYRPARYND